MMSPKAVLIVAACEFTVLVMIAESVMQSKKLTFRKRTSLYMVLAAVSLASIIAAIQTF